MAHECVRDGLLPLLLDLDETVVKAYPIGKLTREIDCLSRKMQHQPECALTHASAAALGQWLLLGHGVGRAQHLVTRRVSAAAMHALTSAMAAGCGRPCSARSTS